MNNFFNKKLLLVLLSLAALLVGVELVFYIRLAITPVTSLSTIPPIVERGSIVDREGKPLAVPTNFYHFGVSPKNIKNVEKFAMDIAPALEMPSNELLNLLQKNADSNFVYVKKRIDQETFTKLKEITDEKQYYTYVTYDKIPGRIYPEKALASQLIGYMGNDGKGLSGIEYSMQNELKPVPSDDDIYLQQGKNVYLTIDANLQYKLEKLSRETMETTKAESMMMIAADARNGEILSYISLPSSNLNEYTSAEIEETIDRPAMTAYEPGSVFKIFTVAINYDHGYIRPDETFICDGVYERKIKGGETVRIKCLEHHGTLTPRESLKYSCNDVLGQISDRISDEQFISDIRTLGFGSKTGIQLPGETTGFVKDAGGSKWSGRSKATIAIGQEISVSALQMIQAATAIANKGVPLNLSVIKKITNKDGSIVMEHHAEPKERVFKESTASYILSCMETTATTGTGARAKIGDISIGVKTGTAQMADPKGGYSDKDFLSNCIAIFPVEEPKIILYIVVEKAKGETYAGRIVAPVIKKAADEIIDHLGLNRGAAASLEHSGKVKVDHAKPLKIGNVLPDLTGCSKRDLIPLLDRTDLQVKINGYGWVKSQSPEPGTPITENMSIELNLE